MTVSGSQSVGLVEVWTLRYVRYRWFDVPATSVESEPLAARHYFVSVSEYSLLHFKIVGGVQGNVSVLSIFLTTPGGFISES